jgi:hypothetical protein
MKISSEHLAALEALGYAPDEARFLYIVATYSGFFVPRQSIGFAQANGGKRSSHFTRRLESRGHATWREYPRVGGVYHLLSKTLYRVIDKQSLPNRRRHSTEFIRTRLVLLDFVLANQVHVYLETEPEKTAYFCEGLGVPTEALPATSYRASDGGPAIRYFNDRFPLFLDGSADPAITLSYVNSGEATLAGFVRHLDKYKKLFLHLTHFHFLYISDSPVHFISAEKRFQSFVKRALEETVSKDLSRYFKLRAAWDQKQYGDLSNDDVEWLEGADRRFRGEDTERRYAAWCAGPRTDDDLMRLLKDGHTHFRFSCYLVTPGGTAAKQQPDEVAACPP